MQAIWLHCIGTESLENLFSSDYKNAIATVVSGLHTPKGWRDMVDKNDIISIREIKNIEIGRLNARNCSRVKNQSSELYERDGEINIGTYTNSSEENMKYLIFFKEIACTSIGCIL